MSILTRERLPNFKLAGEIINRANELGLYVDLDLLEQVHNNLRDTIDSTITDLEERSWEGISINSRNDMYKLFTEMYDCEQYSRITPTGNYSFDADVLDRIYMESDQPDAQACAKDIMQIRSDLTKANKLRNLAIACDGSSVIHPSWTFGETNRIYYNNPGISNIPIDVRGIIRAPEGYKIVSFDYSQQEPWILFHWLKIDSLLGLLTEYKDVYAAMGNLILGKDVLTTDERSRVKTAWLASSYGATVATIAKEVGDRQFAKKFADTINSIPEIDSKKKQINKRVSNRDLRVESFFGSSRTIDYRGSYTNRAMFNSPIQMTGSDILMFCLEDIDEYLAHNNYTSDEARIYFTMHDQILMLIKEEYLSVIYPIMEIISYQVEDWLPFKLEMKVGDTY